MFYISFFAFQVSKTATWLASGLNTRWIIFQYPQNLAIQRYPVGKWMRYVSLYRLRLRRHLSETSENSINIFVWAVALLAHAACKSFGALLAVRLIMGICEGEYFAFRFSNRVDFCWWTPNALNGEPDVYFLPCPICFPHRMLIISWPKLGAITPGFLIVTGMFYTRAEQNKRVGYWCK